MPKSAAKLLGYFHRRSKMDKVEMQARIKFVVFTLTIALLYAVKAAKHPNTLILPTIPRTPVVLPQTWCIAGPEHPKAQEKLVSAVREGDEAGAAAALSRGADLHIPLPEDDPDDPGGSLMTLAAKLGHLGVISCLLDAGAHVDHRGTGSRTPLYRAAYNGHLPVLLRLVEEGAQLEAREADFGCTSLHVAAQQGHPECVKALVAVGADMYVRDIWGSVPLHRAAFGNKPIAILQLLECGCDPQVKNNFGKTALHFAALGGSVEAAKVLVMHNLSYHEKDNQGFSSLDLARVYSHHEVEWWFLKNPSAEILRLPTSYPSTALSSHSNSLTELREGISSKTEDIQNSLASENVDTNSSTGSNKSESSENAPENSGDDVTLHDMLTKSWRVEEQLSESIYDYIKKGASHLLINIHHSHDGHFQDEAGMTPLHWAVQCQQLSAVKDLLQIRQIYPQVVSYSGETPADLALQTRNTQLIEIINSFQVTKTAENPEKLYEELLTVISTGDDVVKASQLLCRGAPLEPVGSLSSHSLSLAVKSNRRRIVSLLLAAGAPLSCMSGGLTLMQQAWSTPDVTVRVQMLVTRAYRNRLAWEKKQLPPDEELLHKGIDAILEILVGPTPWKAKWKSLGVRPLTALMSKAAQHNCTLTASLLQNAGAQSFLVNSDGSTPLHTALEARHWALAMTMVRDMSASPYIGSAAGKLPRDMMPSSLRKSLEALHEKEKRKVEDMYEKIKDEAEKKDVKMIIQLLDDIFIAYQTSGPNGRYQTPPSLPSIACAALSVAAERGLLQFMYLLVVVGGLHPDTVVDYTNDTTALHLAASHGISGCVALLLYLKASPLQPDKYGHTALHFAAMNCQDTTYQLLVEMVPEEEPVSVAGTVPSEIKTNVESYLKLYHKPTSVKKSSNLPENTDPAEATKTLLSNVGFKDLTNGRNDFTVDFSKGEAREVSSAVFRECQFIVDGVAKQDETYEGELTLVGSSSDGTRLYAPDESDISLVLSNVPKVEVTIVEQDEREVLLSGHKLRMDVKTDAPNFEGNTLIETFFFLVTSHLECNMLHDKRLSIVPPGVTRTQVGVSLSFAWQGEQYPLLLVGVDLVPVLPLPWPEQVARPLLTSPDIREVHLSNKADGTWRCSFAGAEVAVVSQLSAEERRVFLSCKTLLSRLKAEVWMPRDVKALYTWWDSRQWKIPIPAGFAMKNAFLNVLERKRKDGTEWLEEDLVKWMIAVFREMCEYLPESNDFDTHSTSDERQSEKLTPKKIYAYFGGDFEKPKVGDGAPDIIKILEDHIHSNEDSCE